MQYLGLPLARRLESCEGAAGAQFVEARAQLFPKTGACRFEVAGASATFDGPHSPITQSFGLGMFAMPTKAEMDGIEAFFHSRGAAAHHEVSPLAPKELLAMLTERGYRPIELTDVMFLPLPVEAGAPTAITVRLAGRDEQEMWAATSAEGWRDFTEITGQLADLARVFAARTGALSFLAEENGRVIATGGLVIHEGVALMAGASTVPEFRRRGAQRALFSARLAHASQLGCDLAMVCTEPGSDSQRNAAHHGFRVAYTRIKWALDPPNALRLRN
jgi:GNAT superfamily N-acetyltransferase